jgi:hypothetical protein
MCKPEAKPTPKASRPAPSYASKCSTKAAIIMDGVLTCLNCGESKCGEVDRKASESEKS